MANNLFIRDSSAELISVLVFSRSAGIRRYLKKLSLMAGFGETLEAASYEEAFHAIQEKNPDVVIINAKTRVFDSLFEARRVNKIWKNNKRRTPKILALDMHTEKDIQIAREFGFRDIIVLPSSPGIILQRVMNALETLD